jgi:probable rRNA maturation factor
VLERGGLEVEVIGIELAAGGGRRAGGQRADGADSGPAGGGLVLGQVQDLCALALSSAGIADGHVAIEFVGEERIRELNRDHRGKDEPTDVLSFGVDEAGPAAGPRELGDVVICPEHTTDLREAVVHGALHLTGMDHETDDGEMLALQAELLRWMR